VKSEKQDDAGAVGEKTGLVDLHTHTTFSDGLYTPEELVAAAKQAGLAAVAVTDHDAVGGIERATAAGRELGIEVVPGVEMSCNTNGFDVHLLGYYVDLRDQAVLDFFEMVRRKRAERAEKMVAKLAELGFAVSIERVRELAHGAATGRPHVAQAIVEAGVAANTEEAFSRYIGYDGPAYFPKMQLSPVDAIEFVHKHGGVAVVAHPGTYHNDAALYSVIAAGADGIEVWHPDHQQRSVDHYNEVATKNGLIMTGGSDCHGGRKQGRTTIGQLTVAYKYLQGIKDVIARRNRA
jgi:predicted metal-dependent phosphoesterase TrpH